jgi:hypothetical protein
MKTCETCPCEAIDGERFCKPCKKVRLDLMKRDRYLSPGFFGFNSRSEDHKENTRETKFGVDR